MFYNVVIAAGLLALAMSASPLKPADSVNAPLPPITLSTWTIIR